MRIVSFVFNFVTSFIQLVFLLRMLFQFFKVKSNNEVALMVAHFTNPVVKPVRKFLPRTRFIDLSTLSIWIAIDLVKYLLMVYLQTDAVLSGFQLLLLLPCDFIMQTCFILFYSTLFHAILGLVAQGMHNPATETLEALASPLLNLARNFIPKIGALDLSPIAVLIGLKAIQLFITTYLVPTSYFF